MMTIIIIINMDKAKDVSVPKKGLGSLLAKGVSSVLGIVRSKETPPLETPPSLAEVKPQELTLDQNILKEKATESVDLEEQLASCQQTIAEKEQQLTNLEILLVEAQKAPSNVVKVKDHSRGQSRVIMETRQELHATKMSFDELLEYKVSLEHQVEDTERYSHGLEKDIHKLREELESVYRDRSAWEQSMKDARNRFEEQLRIVQLEADLYKEDFLHEREHKEKAYTLMEKIRVEGENALQVKELKMDKSRHAWKETVQKLSRKLEVMNDDLENTTFLSDTSTKESTSRNHQLHEELDRTQTELERTQTELDQTQRELEAAQEEMQAKTAQVKQYKKRNDQREDKLMKLEEMNEQLGHEMERVRQKLEENKKVTETNFQKEERCMKVEMDRVRRELEKEKRNVAHLTKVKRMSKVDIEEEYSVLKAEHETLQEDYENLTKTSAQVEEQFSRLKISHLKFKQSKARLTSLTGGDGNKGAQASPQSTLTPTRTDAEKDSTETFSSSVSRADLEAKIEDLEAQVNEWKSHCDNLQSQLDPLTPQGIDVGLEGVGAGIKALINHLEQVTVVQGELEEERQSKEKLESEVAKHQELTDLSTAGKLSLQEQLDVVETNYKLKVKQLEIMAAEKINIQDQIRRMNARYTASQLELTDCREQLETAIADTSRLSDEVLARTQQIRQYKKQTDSYRATLEDTLRELDNRKNCIQRMEEDHQQHIEIIKAQLESDKLMAVSELIHAQRVRDKLERERQTQTRVNPHLPIDLGPPAESSDKLAGGKQMSTSTSQEPRSRLAGQGGDPNTPVTSGKEGSEDESETLESKFETNKLGTRRAWKVSVLEEDLDDEIRQINEEFTTDSAKQMTDEHFPLDHNFTCRHCSKVFRTNQLQKFKVHEKECELAEGMSEDTKPNHPSPGITERLSGDTQPFSISSPPNPPSPVSSEAAPIEFTAHLSEGSHRGNSDHNRPVPVHPTPQPTPHTLPRECTPSPVPLPRQRIPSPVPLPRQRTPSPVPLPKRHTPSPTI